MWWLLNGVVVTMGCAMIGNLVVNVTLSKWFVVNRGIVVAIAAMGVSFGGIVLTPLATYLVTPLVGDRLGSPGYWCRFLVVPRCVNDASRTRGFWSLSRRIEFSTSSRRGRGSSATQNLANSYTVPRPYAAFLFMLWSCLWLFFSEHHSGAASCAALSPDNGLSREVAAGPSP
ncbi:MAG: hypothetical protein CM15mP120_02110 [Pseudomonadota bacterium]|nr:MAG: hypothetical protein CM15mP120_02110 [Pseudomonadota bacterium]